MNKKARRHIYWIVGNLPVRFMYLFYFDLLLSALLTIKIYLSQDHMWSDWMHASYYASWAFICFLPLLFLFSNAVLAVPNPFSQTSKKDKEALPGFVDEVSSGHVRSFRMPGVISFFNHFSLRTIAALVIVWHEDVSMWGWELGENAQAIIMACVIPLILCHFCCLCYFRSFWFKVLGVAVWVPVGLLFVFPIVSKELITEIGTD